ncbi:HAD family hydrolase [Massilia glaciei]|uniref:HAD family hydrolase n=1 Tax=Massilia glaciei TaxID=1524097 RepID=A0A2U2HIB3_9BURK|nr:HAD family hydrolase [Massilia glaciei]PWF46090.1 HAD family hydrolase [Massilia glaciei]
MHIEAIFLGLDVLLDTEAQQLAATNAAFEQTGLSLRWSLATLRKHARTHGGALAITAALPLAAGGIDRARVDALVAARDALLRAAVAARPPRVEPACRALVDEAIEAGCKVSILTDMPAALTALLLEQCFGHEASSKLAVVAGGQHFGAAAGATGPYPRALQALGVEAQCAILIDTAAPSMDAASAAGMWVRSLAPHDAAEAPLACPQLHDMPTRAPEARGAARHLRLAHGWAPTRAPAPATLAA